MLCLVSSHALLTCSLPAYALTQYVHFLDKERTPILLASGILGDIPACLLSRWAAKASMGVPFSAREMLPFVAVRIGGILLLHAVL